MANYDAAIIAVVEQLLLKDKKKLVTGERTYDSDREIVRLLDPGKEPSWNARDIVAKTRCGGLYSITQTAENWVIRWAVYDHFNKYCEANPLPAVAEFSILAPGEDAPSCADCGSLMVRDQTWYKCLNCGSTLGRS
ncbi:MAG: hypothetical protein A3A33_03430 [Candidatus Yanofskybacteria bacterium RIFCSPLOWO2_01_FULL_49_25]|uniref:Uncharacterized protein n=1 Tax=Candidatus Yanofskybacteria bacterium RIFCSPLOWO2_01_FULL_49_25 TaxID=1802701 RepID=A0A1F8GVX4_9BACT|nr:MAG: hypothetical protein A3A33_03430 [Candidatus Yanofskybacteria bacterium RIFCSPLOWO2_01_FULL_49_25]